MVLMLSLNIHKAFDSVLWPYLELILQKCGFHGAFVHVFLALYHHPCTRIKLTGCNSDYFTLGRGTRQGCPSSPLLCALAIKPLACSISLDPSIRGYLKADQEFKLSMYIDDVLLFLSDPVVSLPNLISSLRIFWPGD